MLGFAALALRPLRAGPRDDAGAALARARRAARLLRRRAPLGAVRPAARGARGPIGTWVVVVLAVLVWPFWTLPFWLLRYGAFTPGGRGAARRPRSSAASSSIRCCASSSLAMWIRSKLDAVGSRVAGRVPGRAARPGTTLARDNAQRNPQRTASTAAALMIGLALVTLVAVLAAGITSTFRGAVERPLERRRLRDHGAEQLLADPDRGRRRGREGARRRGGRQRAHRRRAGVRQDRSSRPPSTRRPAQDLQPRLEGRARRASSRRSATTARSSTTATRRSTTCKVGSPVDADVRERRSRSVRRQGHLRPADRRLAVRPVTISAATWDRFNEHPQQPLLVRAHAAAARPTRTRRALERPLADVPEREGRRRGRSSSTTRSRASARS